MCSFSSSNWQKWPPSWLCLAFWCVRLRQHCRRAGLMPSLSAPWPSYLPQMSALMWVTLSNNSGFIFTLCHSFALVSIFYIMTCSYSTDLQPGSSDARWVRLPQRLRSAAVCPGHQSTSDPRGWAFTTVTLLCVSLLSLHVRGLSYCFFNNYSLCDSFIPLFPLKARMRWWGWSFPEICWQSHDKSFSLHL